MKDKTSKQSAGLNDELTFEAIHNYFNLLLDFVLIVLAFFFLSICAYVYTPTSSMSPTSVLSRLFDSSISSKYCCWTIYFIDLVITPPFLILPVTLSTGYWRVFL